MKKIFLFVILGVLYWQWHEGKLPFMKKSAAVDASGKPTTWIFTFQGCGDSCDNAVRQLKTRRVPFEEKSINPNDEKDANVKLWHKYQNGNMFPVIVAGSNTLSGFNAPDIATLLGKTFGDTYLTYDEKRFFKKHFNSDGSPRIVMYGTDWCPYCAELRKEFKANSIDYTDIDVEKSGEQNLLSQTMGIGGYPATWVGYTRVVQGDNYSEIMALAKQP